MKVGSELANILPRSNIGLQPTSIKSFHCFKMAAIGHLYDYKATLPKSYKLYFIRLDISYHGAANPIEFGEL